jgi:hypothetical protein
MTSDTNTNSSLVRKIEECLRQPIFFCDILAACDGHAYRSVLRAWSDVRERLPLERDEVGRYWYEANEQGNVS